MFGNGKVFVSHTHEDNTVCAPLLAALDAWQVDYWFDTAQLSAGLELLDNIQRGLVERDIFICICTPAASASVWMDRERQLARTLRAPNRSQRFIIDLIMKPGYVTSDGDARDLVIDATHQPEVTWLRKLREALEIPSRERRVSRRAVLGVGVTSLAALGGMGLAGKLLFFTPPSPNLYQPIGHQPTATALPGASRVRWTFSIYPQPFGGTSHVVEAGQTLICAANHTLTAVNKDGTFRWIQRQYNVNTDAPPTVVGDAIYVTSTDVTRSPADPNILLNNTSLAAFNLSDGSQRWQQLMIADPGDTAVTSAVTVAGSAAYVRYNQTLYACDVATGKTLWSQSAGSPPADAIQTPPAPTVAGDTVFAILGDEKLHAFAASNGAPLWPAPFASALPIRTQPVVSDGMVFVGADGGWCYALDVATGAVRWKTPLFNSSVKPQELARFMALGLTMSENVLYISGGFPVADFETAQHYHRGTIQALDPATGKFHWANAPEEESNNTGFTDSLFRAPPLVVGSDIFMATKLTMHNSRDIDRLFALGKQDGKVKWTVEMWGESYSLGDTYGVPSAPIVADGLLYIISGNEILYAISYTD